MADIVGINGSSLHFICKRQFGITPSELICFYRLNKSIDMMFMTERCLDSITQKCGYYYPRRFKENFASIFDENPNQILMLIRTQSSGCEIYCQYKHKLKEFVKKIIQDK